VPVNQACAGDDVEYIPAMQKISRLPAIALLFACVVICPAAEKDKKAAPVKLLTTETRKVIDDHKQIYGMSCIPMSVEMVLKLLGRAPASYYDQQNAWKNKADGNFSNFDGKTINGVTFHKRFGLPRDKNFPLEKLFAAVDRELAAGRYVIISLASGGGWHMYVVCDKDKDGEFIAVSKIGERTITDDHVKRTVTKMQGTDILTYDLAR